MNEGRPEAARNPANTTDESLGNDMRTTPFRNGLLILFAVSLLVTSGCRAGSQANKDFGRVAVTSAPASQPATPPTPEADTDIEADMPHETVADPLYRWNKFWFGFNHLFYGGLMRPFAKGYAFIVPKMVRTGLANAYDNFTFPIRFINALLQLNFTKASREFGRFMINSTLGIGGLMDVAKSDPNLQPGNEDFGQTLGYYGVGDGFYIVWPLLGPSSARDTIGLAGDALANPLFWIFGGWSFQNEDNPWYWSYIIKAGDVFNRLPNTLEVYDSVVKPAVDPYSAIKDAYIQHRNNLIVQ